MKLLIAGAGSIGTVIGMRLATTEKVALLRRTVYSPAEVLHKMTGIASAEFVMEVGDIAHYTGRKFDIIFITTQGQDTESICQQLQAIVTDDTVLVSLQNGVTNGEIIHSYFSQNELILGTVWWSATLLTKDHVYYHNAAPMRLGYYPATKKHQHLEVINSLLQQYFDCDISENIVRELHMKLVLNVVAPTLALVKEPYPQGLRIPEIRTLTHYLFDEALAIVEAKVGVLDDPRLDRFHKLLQSKPVFEKKSALHKVSTQISAEKHGGKGSNVDILLGSLEAMAVGHPHFFISKVKQIIYKLPKKYDKVPLASIQELIHSHENTICQNT